MTEDRFLSYAQNMEDVMLWRALHRAVDGPGFYIDAGASDPTLLSVTRAFYDRGWHGINIEPLPEQAAALRRERPRDIVVQAALSDKDAPAQAFHRVTLSSQTGLSTVDADEAERHRAAGAAVETIEVPVTTLSAICRDHVDGPVHFLKVDVEGSEAAVLAGADFRAVRPWIVLVEATQPLESDAADLSWEAPLLAAGYRHVWFDGLNRFYLAGEHAVLTEHFRLPPNVFDRYSVYDSPLQNHLAAVTALSERRAQVIEEMQADMAELRRALAQTQAQAHAQAQAQAQGQALEQALRQGTAPPAAAAAEPASAATPESASASEPRQSSIRILIRRAVLLAYRLLRPVLRPVAWRIRGFVIGPLQQDIAQNRIRLDDLLARATSAADQSVAAAMERALMTLALEDGREPPSPLVAPKPAKAAPVRLPKTGADR